MEQHRVDLKSLHSPRDTLVLGGTLSAMTNDPPEPGSNDVFRGLKLPLLGVEDQEPNTAGRLDSSCDSSNDLEHLICSNSHGN